MNKTPTPRLFLFFIILMLLVLCFSICCKGSNSKKAAEKDVFYVTLLSDYRIKEATNYADYKYDGFFAKDMNTGDCIYLAMGLNPYKKGEKLKIKGRWAKKDLWSITIPSFYYEDEYKTNAHVFVVESATRKIDIEKKEE